MSGNGAVRSIAFSKDGRLLAVGCSCSSLQLWDTSTYESVGEPMALDSIANVAAFSPDGNTVASGSDDGSIQLWDVGNQSKLGSVLRGHPLMITSLEFSPDGTKLLSASDDHTLRLWPVPARSADAARDTLCAKLTHNMTAEQWKNMVSPEIDYIKVCPGLPEAEYSG
jgi:WD40 repeat protein